MERPGGTRALDKQIAAIIGWKDIGEHPGTIDMFGKPPGSDKVEPVPFYSSVSWLSGWALEAFIEQGGEIQGEIPAEPWKICEQIIMASKTAQRS